jgi:predicted RecA/RadA family phage recombinase
MKNFIQPGGHLVVAAPYNVSAGDGVKVGSLFGVASVTVLSGADVVIVREGVFDLKKTSAQAWAQGDAIYWDDTNKEATNVAGGNLPIGKAVATAANPTSTGKVALDPTPGLRVVGGQLTTVTASDTVVTGLTKVLAAVATLESDPGDDPMLVSAQIGDQNGAPAAGSIVVKTWKNTGGTDPTPAAASTFSKKVNWLAWGY